MVYAQKVIWPKFKFKYNDGHLKCGMASSTASLPSIPVFWAALDYLAILNTIPSHYNTGAQYSIVQSAHKLNESRPLLVREGFTQLLFADGDDIVYRSVMTMTTTMAKTHT